jgi:hypothetical protein
MQDRESCNLMGLHDAWCPKTMLNEYIKHFRGALASLFYSTEDNIYMKD